jgi:coenzyme F420 hydrogenase subunit beta
LSANLGFDDLKENVIESGICSGCGACVVVCPFINILEYSNERPILVGECKNCSICPKVCPRNNRQNDELEEFIFGRRQTSDDLFGIFKNIYVSRSMDEEILKNGQDGGVASTILTSALNLGLIDGAIISGIDSSTAWLPIPFVATQRNEIIENAGTRYTYSPNIIAFKKAINDGLKKIAFVGTPCQILALRWIQNNKLKKYTKPLIFTIGLFCSESFSYRGLMIEKIQKKLGIDLNEVVKMNIKGRMLVYLRNGQIVKIPLKEVREYAQQKCRHCTDFSAEFADISLGGIGLNQMTLSIVRTDKGREVFNQVISNNNLKFEPFEKFDNSLKLLKRLSLIKQKKRKNGT